MEIDLEAPSPVVRFGGREIRGAMPESTRRSLVEGQWDALGQLLDGREATEALAARLPATAEGRLTRPTLDRSSRLGARTWMPFGTTSSQAGNFVRRIGR